MKRMVYKIWGVGNLFSDVCFSAPAAFDKAQSPALASSEVVIFKFHIRIVNSRLFLKIIPAYRVSQQNQFIVHFDKITRQGTK